MNLNTAVFLASEMFSVERIPLSRFDSLYDELARTDEPGPAFAVGVPFWVAAGDTARLAAGLTRSVGDANASSSEAMDVSGFLKALLKLAVGDSSDFRNQPEEALAGPLGLIAESPLGLFPVEMELAMGREEQAWKLLQSRGGWGVISQIRWMLYRARLAEKRGERDIALENYGYVARIWADADEPLRSHAREAREALNARGRH